MGTYRILLAAQREYLRFCRSKQALLLVIGLAGLGALQLVVVGAVVRPKVFEFNGVVFASYNGFIQLLPLALATVLAGSVCGEKESRVWYFYLSKPFREWELIAGKSLFYSIAVGAITLLAWWITVAAAWQSTAAGKGETATGWGEQAYLSLIVLGVTLMIVNMGVMVSALARRAVAAALLIVILWLLLTLANAALAKAPSPTELGGGMVAPFSAYSTQTKTVMQLLKTVPAAGSCPSCPEPVAASFSRVAGAALLSTLEGLIFLALAMVLSRWDPRRILPLSNRGDTRRYERRPSA